MTTPTFDINAAIQALREGKDLTGKDGILTPLIKQLTEAALAAELDGHLASTEGANRKNGKTTKTVKSPLGNFELNTPRDRAGTFEPQLVKKHQTQLTDEMERKIIGLFSLGSSYQDIRAHIEDMYGMPVSNGTVNAITDKLLPELQAWRERELEPLYPVIWLDAIHYKIKENGRFISKAVYTILALNVEGKKELLGLYLSDNEGAHHWLSVLTDLYNRGIKDIFIAYVDGLKGFPDAIEAVYPKTQVQLCIVHQIRNSLRFVSWKERKAVAADLKTIYGAATLQQAELALEQFAKTWDKQHPSISKSWRENWTRLSVFFDYPPEIRKVIYTTNAIESLNASLRQVTKTRRSFPSDDAVLKLLYLALHQIAKKWTMPLRDWKPAMTQFMIMYSDRVSL